MSTTATSVSLLDSLAWISDSVDEDRLLHSFHQAVATTAPIFSDQEPVPDWARAVVLCVGAEHCTDPAARGWADTFYRQHKASRWWALEPPDCLGTDELLTLRILLTHYRLISTHGATQDDREASRYALVVAAADEWQATQPDYEEPAVYRLYLASKIVCYQRYVLFGVEGSPGTELRDARWDHSTQKSCARVWELLAKVRHRQSWETSDHESALLGWKNSNLQRLRSRNAFEAGALLLPYCTALLGITTDDRWRPKCVAACEAAILMARTCDRICTGGMMHLLQYCHIWLLSRAFIVLRRSPLSYQQRIDLKALGKVIDAGTNGEVNVERVFDGSTVHVETTLPSITSIQSELLQIEDLTEQSRPQLAVDWTEMALNSDVTPYVDLWTSHSG